MSNKEYESHPSWGVAMFNNAYCSQAEVMFDSSIKHGHYVILTIWTARKARDLNRNWIHDDKELIKIRMSSAQFGALVSSFGGRGVPITLERIKGQRIDDPELESELELTAEEVSHAADRVFDAVTDASAALDEALTEKPPKMKRVREAARSLSITIQNAAPNMKFAADSMTEHTEAVVTKAKRDIEAMVDSRASELGIHPAQLQLDAGDALNPQQ